MGMREKSPAAFRTISEVADDLALPQHVLRFWETRFSQIRPMKRGGGRRYYRPEDIELLRGIRHLLYEDGYTIKGVQRILKQRGSRHVAEAWQPVPEGQEISPPEDDVAHPHQHETEQGDSGGWGPAMHEPREEAPAMPVKSAGGMAMESAEANGSPALPREAVARLRAVLLELKECRRVLDEALPASKGRR